MTDISAYKPSERTIEIVSPGRNPRNLGIRVSLMSISDDRMKGIKRRITDRKLFLDARGKHFKSVELEENSNDVSFEAMTGWEWYKVDKNGNEWKPGLTEKIGDETKPVAQDDPRFEQATFHGSVPGFNKRDVYAVFDELSWLRDQIDEAISEEKDFFA